MKITEFLNPKKIAIIGASSDGRKPGNIVLRNLKDFYKIYPINPNRAKIEGLKCHKSIGEIDDEIDWAIITLPAEKSKDALRTCVDKGVKLAIIIAGGFGETGQKEQEDELKRIAGNRCRVIGPNTVGMLIPDKNLNTIFIPDIKFVEGNIAFLAQSGSIGVILMEEMAKEGLGVSLFAGLGNRIDLDENEFLDFLEEDRKTDVISLYLESFSNAKEFFMKCKKISTKKPVVLMKAGNNKKSNRAIISHTGKISNISSRLMSDIMAQNGVIEAHNLEEIMDFTKSFSKYKKAYGGKIAIITSAGGLGIIATDHIPLFSELSLTEFDRETVDKLTRVLPPFASCGNPVDLTADATNEMYSNALEIVGNCDDVDMILCLLQFHPSQIDDSLLGVVDDMSRKTGKPILYNITGMDGDSTKEAEKDILVYPSINRAMGAMNALAFRGRWLKREIHEQNNDAPSDNHDLTTSLCKYGIKIPSSCVIENEEEIENMELNFPVACKIHSNKIYHKTDYGGVYLNIKSEKELRETFLKLKKRFNKKVEVQEMVKGFEFILGTTHHNELGEILMCGAGGVMTELYMDTSFRMFPLSRKDAEDMIQELKIAPIFNGYRKIKVGEIGAKPL